MALGRSFIAQKIIKITPRREIRLALLAAMETCWLYAILGFVATLTGLNRPVSPLSLFAAYWIALLTGRLLPRLHLRWLYLQLMAVGIAILTLLTVIRIQVVGDQVSLLDPSWVLPAVRSIFLFDYGMSTEFLTAIGIIYVFVRGLGFGQRPLTLWFMGFQFRLGIVVFFLLFATAAFLKHYDASLWVFIYFFLSLFAIALARLDEMGSNLRFGARWFVTIFSAIALVLFLGLGLLQMLTVDTVAAFLQLFSPLATLAGLLLLLIIIPASWVVEWLFTLLRPLFARFHLAQIMQNVLSLFQQFQENRKETPPLIPLPVLQTLVVLAIVVGISYLLARALNRRMKEIEEESYVRESVGPEEDAKPRRESTRRKRPRPSRAGKMAAETIRRIYAALVARAAEVGLARRVAETPYEFLPRLERAWPDERVPIRDITDAYVAVHYGEHEATAAEVERVRKEWREVEKAIKRKM